MYKVNLYPEYFDRRREARQRVILTGALSALAALGLLLIVSLAVSARLLEERAGQLRAEIPKLESQLQAAQAPNPDFDTAQQLLKLRQDRLAWSPKLAALATGIGPSIRLLEVTGSSKRKGEPPKLSLVGVTAHSRAGMEPVVAFMDALRSEPTVSTDLPNIQLENLKGGGSSRFRIVCETETQSP